jgi:uncharacterized protein (TIGR02246 family)
MSITRNPVQASWLQALILGCCLAISAHAAAADEEADKRAAEAVIRSLQEHWNRGDMDAYLARYEAADTLRLTFGNTIIEGRDALDALFRASYPDPERMGRFTIERLDTRIIDADTAIAHGNFTHVFPHETVRGGFSHVLHRSASGEWVIVHERTSRGETIEHP